MDSKFSPRIKDVLSYSKEEAERLGNSAIGTEHLFLGILREGEGIAVDILISLGVDLYDIRKNIEREIKSDTITDLDQNNIPLQRSAERVLKLIYLEAKALKNNTIDTSHLLLAILKDDKSMVTQILEDQTIDYNKVKENLKTLFPKAQADYPSEEREGKGGMSGGSKGSSTRGKSETPVLDNFGIDITKSAEEGTLDPIVVERLKLND
ncbi:Clp protease N-terminal domain-containing protein [Marinifilum fragile]|uniref:Clp protease N-terminal domain-containing protein n=1 Tax=Marinifilum fragile TaxID=570161 RepID=UPI000AEB88E6|nr:Clp protease N-terminal domain-containing protein [Marinifilum fragile]